MHDALDEVIDRLVAGGMDEYHAVSLISKLLAQEAREFIEYEDQALIEADDEEQDNLSN